MGVTLFSRPRPLFYRGSVWPIDFSRGEPRIGYETDFHHGGLVQETVGSPALSSTVERSLGEAAASGRHQPLLSKENSPAPLLLE